MKAPEEVITWLREQNCLNMFCKNAHISFTEASLNLSDFIKENKEWTIDFAFNWCGTREGREFWEMLNDRFQEWY